MTMNTKYRQQSMAKEITMLRKSVKEQDKEIRRLKEENEFMEEVSAPLWCGRNLFCHSADLIL